MPNAVVGTVEQFFEDYANGNYVPKMSGPLYNGGADYEGMASVDLAGNTRVSGGRVDIGCFESRRIGFSIIFR